MMVEQKVTVNGTELTIGQITALRVACVMFINNLTDPTTSLGNDVHGKRMAQQYKQRASEILNLLGDVK